eukprot:gnl/Hemi2/28651_TR9511_c0_g1_i1.p2 gnl/Hemi2/28651_TR9511_c0_g1~~gnl/Hemi2/28651_TR9511_c0_g1_i1.p2  ORF type:complete len:156 (+),score=56.29 gnl/Hemi2/28651_TR9511_c0_g1_i1:69-470(+)
MGLGNEEDAGDLRLGRDFEGAKCLMNSEVAIILELRQQQQQANPDDDLPPTFTKTLSYVQRFSRYRNKEAVKEVREILNRTHPALEEFEKALVGNLSPEGAEEARCLIPSLQNRFEDDNIEALLADLSNFRKL